MTDTIDPGGLISRWSEELTEHGYYIARGALAPGTIAALDADLADDFVRTPFCQGGFYGATTKRFGRLLIRSPLAETLVRHETILGVAERLLLPWCDRIQLNVTQAIAVHPNAPSQLPHRDHEMWRVPAGKAEYLLNVIWPLTGFTAENGATRVWPRSHGANALAPAPSTDPIAAEMAPGDALLFLGSTLHGAGANHTSDVRRGIVVGYSLGWLKPYENQWLAYPPDIARRFPPELAALVGYRQHRPNLGNYEGQCPSVLLDERGSKPLAAIDALRPDQEAAVAAYVASQTR